MDTGKKNIRIQITLAIIFFIIFAVGFYLADPVQAGLCSEIQLMCQELIGESIGQPMMMFSLALFIVSIVLIFTREAVFYTWLKYFASWFVPLSVLLIYLMPVDGGSSFSPVGADKELSSWFFSILFLIISVLIIIWKSVKLRQANGLINNDGVR